MRVQDDVTLCNRRDYPRYAHVGVSGSGRWSSHRAVPRNHRCCHWHPRHALSRNHIQSTIMIFPLLVPILILLSGCFNSSSLFPVAILRTLLQRENTSFEVWYLQLMKRRAEKAWRLRRWSLVSFTPAMAFAACLFEMRTARGY